MDTSILQGENLSAAADAIINGARHAARDNSIDTTDILYGILEASVMVGESHSLIAVTNKFDERLVESLQSSPSRMREVRGSERTFSTNAAKLVKEAETMALQLGSSTIGARHILAALLGPKLETSGARRLIAQYQPIEGLRDSFLSWLRTNAPPTAAAYERYFQARKFSDDDINVEGLSFQRDQDSGEQNPRRKDAEEMADANGADRWKSGHDKHPQEISGSGIESEERFQQPSETETPEFLSREVWSQWIDERPVSKLLIQIVNNAAERAGGKAINTIDLAFGVLRADDDSEVQSTGEIPKVFFGAITHAIKDHRPEDHAQLGKLEFASEAWNALNEADRLRIASGNPRISAHHLVAALVGKRLAKSNLATLISERSLSEARESFYRWITGSYPAALEGYRSYFATGSTELFHEGSEGTSPPGTGVQRRDATVNVPEASAIFSALNPSVVITPSAQVFEEATLVRGGTHASSEDSRGRGEHSRFASDQVEALDLLGIQDEVHAFARLIAADSTRAPLAIGLFGNWGSGKSTFMQLLAEDVDSLASSKRRGYLENIVQIEFNAWHYMDANLWASLVGHMFYKLGKKLDVKDLDEIDLGALGTQLKDAVSKKEEAEDREKNAIEDLQNKERDVRERQHELEEKRATLADVRFQDVLDLAKNDPAIRSYVTDLKKKFGVDNIESLVDQIDAGGKEVTELYSDSRSFYRILSTNWPIGILVIVLASISLFGFAVKSANIQWPSWLSGATVAALVPILAWAHSAAQWGREALSGFRSSMSKLQDKRRASLSAGIRTAQTELDKAEGAVKQSTEEVRLAAEEVGRIKQKIVAIKSGAMLDQFLSERAGSDDYTKHGGIISMIRKDFEKLSGLMEHESGHPEKKVSRIVLYIDDLDRCPWDRVVEVLQAIHLLLYFKLFVVVVGIDPLWMNRSIRTYYQERMGLDPDKNQREIEEAPGRYLEKIFQIPFALRPISELPTHDLIAALLDTPSSNEKRSARDQSDSNKLNPPELPAHEVLTANRDSDIQLQISPLTIESREAIDRDNDDKEDGPEEDGGEATIESEEPNTSRQESVVAEPIVLTNIERGYLERFLPHMPSPRAAKRLVNIVHLLKVLYEDKVWNPGSAILALSVLIGYPGGGSSVLEKIISPAPEHVWDALQIASHYAVSDTLLPEDVVPVNPFLLKLRGDASTSPDTFNDFALWAKRVQRFSCEPGASQ